jgi:type IV pilus assembly protein PilC
VKVLYSYKAIDAAGRNVFGRAGAANLLDLEQRIRRMGLDLVVGAPARGKARAGARAAAHRQDLIHFCFHLEQLIGAGIQILEALADLRDSCENRRFRAVIAGLVEAIEGGQSLSQALAQYPEAFGSVFVGLVRVGEQTGKLPEVLKSVAAQMKWEDELAAQTRRVLLYPLFVGAIVALVTVFLMVYLVPQMTGFIRNAGQEIPLQTRVLIRVSALFVDFWWAILGLPLALWFGLKTAAGANPALAYALDRYRITAPLVGPILRKIILSRFASSFALMYASGITVLDAIRSCEDLVGNRPLAAALRSAGQQIGEGKTLSGAFHDTGLFPPLVVRMLKVGESTGALDTALVNVGYFYDRDVREAIGRLQAMIEPALTLVLGAILGWVMLAVLGPVYDSISKMKF